MSEEHRKMRLCITKRNTKQNPLFAFPAPSGTLNIGKIVVLNGAQ
jgi:hypothetical protein